MGGEAEIGNILREARERQNQSIQNAVEATKIRSKYLLALENGQFDVIPGQVYIKGFIRSYAKFLGLDGEELVSRLKVLEAKPAATDAGPENSVPEPLPAVPEPVRVPSPRTMRVARRENYLRKDLGRMFKTLLRLFVVVVIIFAVVTFVKTLPINEPPPDTNGPVQNPGEQPVGPDETPDGQTVDPPAVTVTVLAEDDTKTVYGITGDTITVTIAAEGSCWVGVYRNPNALNNDFASQVTLRSGEQQDFAAPEKLGLRVGDPGVINLTVNGVDLGAPGEVGFPKTLVFQKQ